MRTPIRSNCWLCVFTSFALVMAELASPIRSPLTSDGRLGCNLPRRNFALVSQTSGVGFTKAVPGRESAYADSSDLDEEDELESFWSPSLDVCPLYITSASPPKPLSGSSRGTSPPRTAGRPLRC